MSKTNTEYNKEYYKKNKEKVLAKNKAWNDTHSERLKELSAKRYAERPKPEPKPRQPRPRKFTSKHERYRHYQYKRLYGI